MFLLPQASYIASCKAQLTPDLLRGKSCLIVGATSGIGRAIAIHLAEFGANVILAGRSKSKGTSLLASLNSIKKDKQRITFESVDLSSQIDMKRFIEAVRSRLQKTGGLDYLFTTAGEPPKSSYIVNGDGIESHFAIQCLGRYSTVFGLIDVVNPGSSVVVVCVPGGSGSIPQDDCDFAKAPEKHGFIAAASRDALFLDSILIQLHDLLRPKGVNVLHIAPGLVNTDAFQAFPFPVPFLARLLGRFLFTGAMEYAYTPILEAIKANGCRRLNQYGKPVPLAAWTEDVKNREMCVAFAERRIRGVLDGSFVNEKRS